MSNTGIPGVYFNTKTRRYHATIRRQGKNYNAGYHKTVEEASAAVEVLRAKLDPPAKAGRKPGSRIFTENHPASTGEVFMPAPGTDQIIRVIDGVGITANNNEVRNEL